MLDFTVFEFPAKTFVYIYCMLKKTGSSFLRYTSYLTKTAHLARVFRLSFRFLWLCIHVPLMAISQLIINAMSYFLKGLNFSTVLWKMKKFYETVLKLIGRRRSLIRYQLNEFIIASHCKRLYHVLLK